MAVSAIPSVSGSNPAQQSSAVSDPRAEQARQLRREEAARREQEVASAEQQSRQAQQAARAEQERQTQQADAVRRQQLESQQSSQNSTSPSARIGQNINTTA
ncbi:hypothetical protein ASD15_02795 [Massilia sp. Root351]|uniref:hypothetical protein n=1 Tax=Massilia sp. Root351 TaxID=1736522 RepID=UPI000709079C|nr:hypothetical protein [Massilia sp. Root351]KQV90999.1 hypothetical protein ASD15_02795 [Massilia sp. Root351]